MSNKKKLIKNNNIKFNLILLSILIIFSSQPVISFSVLYQEPSINAIRINYNELWIDGVTLSNNLPSYLNPLRGISDAYSGQLLITQLHPTSQFYSYSVSNPPQQWIGFTTWPNILVAMDSCSQNGNLLETVIFNDYNAFNPFNSTYSVGYLDIAPQDISNHQLQCIQYKTDYDNFGNSVQIIQKSAFFTPIVVPNPVSPSNPGNKVSIQLVNTNLTTRTFRISIIPLVTGRNIVNSALVEIPSLIPINIPSCQITPNTQCTFNTTLIKNKTFHLVTEDSAGVFTVDSFVS